MPHIPQQAVLPRICVQPPYFALDDFSVTGSGELTCTAPIQMRPDPGSEILMAEAARHSAIAGLCAVASTAPDNDRRYYLARTAVLDRIEPPEPVTVERADIAARGHPTADRSATATVDMSAGGRKLFRLTIEYVVLTEEEFDATFGMLRRRNTGDGPIRTNPYTEKLPLRDVQLTADSASARVIVAPDECVGHFPGYPALPVAHLLTAEFELGAQLAVERLGGRPVVPVTGELVDARTLLPPEHSVRLRAEPVGAGEDLCTVEMTASEGGTDAVWTRFVYRVADSAGPG